MYRRLRILESNLGRDHGWYVEVEGRRLAVLTDCRWHDQFWESYHLEPLTNDPAELLLLFTDDFWGRSRELAFRSREFEEAVPDAYPSINAGTVLKESGRLVVRRLYLDVPCYDWDSLLLWLRRLWRRR